jgi:biopolymer transport protein ExbB
MQEIIEYIREQGSTIWEGAVDIWFRGGWAMVAIAVIAFVMFGLGLHVYLNLRAKGFHAVSESKLRRWIDCPAERKGPVGELLDRITGRESVKDTTAYFQQLHTTETTPFERDLRVMRICVSAAPLVGLLGTVMGMLATFEALATGSGGDKTMALIAEGISEALYTTMTGLVIALPGLFLQYHLVRRFERYKAFLSELETVCTQTVHHRIRQRQRLLLVKAAKERIAQTIRERLSQRAHLRLAAGGEVFAGRER